MHACLINFCFDLVAMAVGNVLRLNLQRQECLGILYIGKHCLNRIMLKSLCLSFFWHHGKRFMPLSFCVWMKLAYMGLVRSRWGYSFPHVGSFFFGWWDTKIDFHKHHLQGANIIYMSFITHWSTNPFTVC